MSWPIQDLFDAFKALLVAAPGSPSLVVFDGEVSDAAVPPYVKVDFYIETRDGLSAPDAVSLNFDSDVIDARVYVHCVGGDPQAVKAARAVAGRVRGAVLNKTLTTTGRSNFPIRWLEGQPAQRNEETLTTVQDLVDVYGWRSLPA